MGNLLDECPDDLGPRRQRADAALIAPSAELGNQRQVCVRQWCCGRQCEPLDQGRFRAGLIQQALPGVADNREHREGLPSAARPFKFCIGLLQFSFQCEQLTGIS